MEPEKITLLKQIESILSSLTQNEKYHLLKGSPSFSTPLFLNNKILKIRMTDGPHGVRSDSDLNHQMFIFLLQSG